MGKFQQIIKLHSDKAWFMLVISLFSIVVWYAVHTFNEYLLAIPLGIIVISIGLYNVKYFWYLTIFFVPLSMTANDLFGGAGLTMPTDPFCLIVLGLVIFKMVSERKAFLDYINHPIAWLLLLNGFWLLFTAIDSVRPTVSIKWFIQYSWLVGVFFFVPAFMFRDKRTMYRFLQIVSVGFLIALNTIFIIYLSSGRNPFGLRFNPGPFFVDHTVFGAFTAMWVPLMVIMAFRMDLSKREKKLARAALFFFVIGLFFSYSRGAWASCVASLAFMWIFAIGKKARRYIIPVLFFGLCIGGYFYYNNSSSASSQTKAAVSRKDLSSHIASVTNFKTDYSNAERINRWYCAIEMWKRDPWTGYGPGTYAMEYATFQRAVYTTPVSTNHGDNGTAHNEFLLALSEQGIPGMAITLILFIVPIVIGLRGYERARDKNTKSLYLGVTFALVAYDIHALVNNFLDQDKIAMTYYGFLAILLALDKYGRWEEKKKMGLKTDLPDPHSSKA